MLKNYSNCSWTLSSLITRLRRGIASPGGYRIIINLRVNTSAFSKHLKLLISESFEHLGKLKIAFLNGFSAYEINILKGCHSRMIDSRRNSLPARDGNPPTPRVNTVEFFPFLLSFCAPFAIQPDLQPFPIQRLHSYRILLQ